VSVTLIDGDYSDVWGEREVLIVRKLSDNYRRQTVAPSHNDFQNLTSSLYTSLHDVIARLPGTRHSVKYKPVALFVESMALNYYTRKSEPIHDYDRGGSSCGMMRKVAPATKLMH